MQQLNDRFEVVSVLDDAIDREAMTLEAIVEYAKSRDPKLLKFKPGKRPTRYMCREVPDNMFDSYVEGADNDAERWRRAFQCGVVEVKALVQQDGTAIDCAPAGMPANDYMPEAELKRFSRRKRREIGFVIWQRSFLAPETALAFLLPPSWLSMLTDLGFRRADASPPSQAQSNSEASLAQADRSEPSTETATAPSPSASACATPTAATATTGPAFDVQNSSAPG